ncbi:hypothetical protein F4802DRAFT_124467 [Xylaria palmicola]|nr:hypothetical protein F4802DRAFT_124467 [Xylaria palmicola]
MGNTPSVEAPKGSRTAQKLSKPRTGNPTTAGLLIPNGVSDIIRRPPSTTGRRLSLPYNTPVSSPLLPESGYSAVDDDLAASCTAAAHIEDCSHPSLLQADPEGALHQRSQSVGAVISSNRSRCMSWTGSTYFGADEGYEQAQFGVPPGLPRNLSQSSINYDLSSYEAKRLLNLVGGAPFEDQSVASESQFHAALSRRQSYTPSYHPTHSDTVAPVPRTESDASLYTPMRRRSLLTPGVATRPAPVDPIVPLKRQIKESLPPIQARRDSLDSTRAGFLSIPPPSFNPSLMPRAHTPCEAEYKQTGAFKHGTLRITNGSPARTPVWEAADEALRADTSSTPQNGYFDTARQVQDKENVESDGNQWSIPPCPVSASPIGSANNIPAVAGEQEAAIPFLPELKLTMSPFSIDEIEQGSPELQTTSKHTAIEDELFEDGSQDFDDEVLSLCLNHETKPRSFPLAQSLDRPKRKEIIRLDSGIVASPMSSTPHKSLSKADSGYSSSVSIRSLSSKRNGQKDVDHSRNLEAISTQNPPFEHEKSPGNTLMPACSATVDPGKVRSQAPSRDETPPPVPQKDHNRAEEPAFTLAIDSDTLQPIQSSINEASKSSHRSVSSQDDPSTPTSTLSIGNARKPGRLQRLLSGARGPLAVHVTHALDRNIHVPPVPHAVQEKLHERAGSSPDVENFQEGNDACNDSRKLTVTSKPPVVCNNESTNQATDDGPTVRTDREKPRGLKSSFHIHSLSSTLTRAASSVMTKNPILRKQTLTKAKVNDQDTTNAGWETSAESTQAPTETSRRHRKDVAIVNSVPLASTRGRSWYGAPKVKKGRSNSVSTPSYDEASLNSLTGQGEHDTSALRKTLFSGQHPVSRTPPPVSMKTRNMGPLRVPPPIRPRSTPPVNSGGLPLSRKPSREGVQSYPPYNYPTNANHASLSRRSSQESLYAYSAAQIQAYINQPSQTINAVPVRPFSVQPHQGKYWAPGGIPNTKFGSAPSREPSFDHSRRNSLASQSSQRSTLSNRHPWPHYPSYDAPTLRHRSSYDGYSFQTLQNYGPNHGVYPLLTHVNGQPYLLGAQPMLPQPDQYQNHARYGSRGHLRHHSLDQYGNPAPYRVLHSYNSPAYKGVPIWSS